MKDDCVLYQIKSLEKAITRILMNESACKEINSPLTMTQIQIVDYLLDNDEVYQKDIEHVLNLRRATVSGVLKNMEKNKLIERVVSSSDLRTKKIVLNENTKKIFMSKIKKLKDLENIVIKDITKEELITFNEIICKMKNNINLYGKEN